MIETRTVIRDQPQLRTRMGQQLGVDPVGNGWHQDIGRLHRLRQFLRRKRNILRVEGDIEEFLHPGLNRFWKPPCHEHVHRFGGHADSCFSGDACRLICRINGTGRSEKSRDYPGAR